MPSHRVPWDARPAELSFVEDAGGVALAELPPVPRDPTVLRQVFSQYPTGIAAVCASVDGVVRGMIVTSFSVGASFEPPLVQLSAQRSSRTWPMLASAPRIGVSVLSERNRNDVGQLASRNADRFDGIELAATREGAVFIVWARVWLDCTLHSTPSLGDHELAVLEVHSASAHVSSKPLAYHDGEVL